MTTLADVNARIADAEQARHNLLTGQGVVEVVADGYTTRYQRADVEKLKAYIDTLYEVREALQGGGRLRRGAIGFTFA